MRLLMLNLLEPEVGHLCKLCSMEPEVKMSHLRSQNFVQVKMQRQSSRLSLRKFQLLKLLSSSLFPSFRFAFSSYYLFSWPFNYQLATWHKHKVINLRDLIWHFKNRSRENYPSLSCSKPFLSTQIGR